MSCIVRPPIDILGSKVMALDVSSLAKGVTPFEQTGDAKRRAKLSQETGTPWTLALSFLSWTTTNGVDYTTARRLVQLALVDGSGKVDDFEATSGKVEAIRKSIIFNRVVPTLFIAFPEGLEIPRDVNGPLLKRLYWEIGADSAGDPNDWNLQAGLIWKTDETR